MKKKVRNCNAVSSTISVALTAAVCAASATAIGQQVTGTLGSPDATTTISGKQLPAPDPKFGGVIKDDALQSKPWWAPRIVPPKGAPNILLIITDDAGFGVPSTFGGVIPTPGMDRIAKNGLGYNNIHSTALSSPTRAALITGRNHHSAGFGVVSEQSTGFPGYNSIIAKDKATIGRILLDNGYATSWFGKDHNTPAFAASQSTLGAPLAPRAAGSHTHPHHPHEPPHGEQHAPRRRLPARAPTGRRRAGEPLRNCVAAARPPQVLTPHPRHLDRGHRGRDLPNNGKCKWDVHERWGSDGQRSIRPGFDAGPDPGLGRPYTG